jgi:hypothetical protein
MKVHANATLGPAGRLALVQAIERAHRHNPERKWVGRRDVAEHLGFTQRLAPLDRPQAGLGLFDLVGAVLVHRFDVEDPPGGDSRPSLSCAEPPRLFRSGGTQIPRRTSARMFSSSSCARWRFQRGALRRRLSDLAGSPELAVSLNSA